MISTTFISGLRIRRTCLPCTSVIQRTFAVRELPWCAPKDSPNRRNSRDGASSSSPASPNNTPSPIDAFGIVAAMDRNRVIGVDGQLPWNLPQDRKAFKTLTANTILVLGRRTFEEEPSRCHIAHAAQCIVISKTLEEEAFENDEKIRLVRSFPEALALAKELVQELPSRRETHDDDRIDCWVVGGEAIYHEALLHPSARCLHLTIVDTKVDVKDQPEIARFPPRYRWDNKFQEQSKEEHVSTDDAISGYTHYIYRRLRGRR